MVELPTLYPELGECIEAQLADLADVPPGGLGKACEELCVFMRTAGIGALLLEMDVDRFYHMLIRSGLTRAFLLSRTPPAEKQEARFCVITRSNGFFDALAADRFDIASNIAYLSPPKWNRKYEYEDDYCYVRFLHEIVRGSEKAVKEEILHRFTEILEGEKSNRLEILAALLEGSADQFEEAFAALLVERTSDLDLEQKSLARNEVEFAAGRFVFIEGLALLRIAARAGFQTKVEYEYCPKEARLPMQVAFPDDGYPK